MYGFWRLGTRPAPSRVRGCVPNGLETTTSMNAKKVAIAAKTGHDPRDQVAQEAAIDGDRERGVARQHEQPEQQ